VGADPDRRNNSLQKIVRKVTPFGSPLSRAVRHFVARAVYMALADYPTKFIRLKVSY
jgi:hypothetical protein